MKGSQITSDPGYSPLKTYVIEHTGLAYYTDKDQDLAMRLARRLEATRLGDCAAYLMLLRDGPRGEQEMDALVGELTIGETYFFRQSEHFDALRNVIFPKLIERNLPLRRLNIWSAGCATGAEAYSVALLLWNDLADKIAGWDISILGTDINRDFLARAREAKFDNWAFRADSRGLKTIYFEPDGKRWVLRPEYRKWVTFRQHNLVQDVLPQVVDGGVFDLILCRNVMIYFSPQAIRETVNRLYTSLAPGGWLLVGHAEPNAEVFKAFRSVDLPAATLYQKSPPHKEPAPAIGRTAHIMPFPAEKPNVERVPVARSAPSPRGVITHRMPTPAGKTVTLDDVRRLADRGEWETAASSCETLLESDSLNAEAHFMLALILAHSGSADEAEKSFRRAIYLDRSFVLAHYHLGLCLQRRRNGPQARRTFENVLSLLKDKPPGEPLKCGDGITIEELGQVVMMHLAQLEKV